MKKKIVSLIIAIIIAFMIPSIVNAADFYCSCGDHERKSLGGIYHAMLKDGHGWLSSKPSRGGGWGSEYYRPSKRGVVLDPNALCFGHASSNNGDKMAIVRAVIDMNEKNKNYSEQLVAYLIKKATDNRATETGSEAYYKMKIRSWSYDNFKNYGGTIQNKDGNKYTNYNISEARSYADSIVNQRFTTNSGASSAQRIKYQNGYTFIGPYHLNHNGGSLSKITITTKSGKSVTTTKYSTNGSSVGDISTFGSNYNASNFYVVYQGELDSVDKIVLEKKMNVITARMVMSEPQDRGGQNVDIYYGEENEKTFQLTLPGVPYSSIKIVKTDAETGKALANVGFVIHLDGKGYLINGSPVRYTSNINSASRYTTNSSGVATVGNLDTKGTYGIYEVSNPNQGYLSASPSQPSKSVVVVISSVGQVVEMKITNPKISHLKIIKKDAGTAKPLANVGFVVYSTTDGYLVDGRPSKYTWNINQATIYRTNTQGTVMVNNIPKKGTYVIYEVVNPNFGYADVSLQNPLNIGSISITSLGNTIEKTLNNTRKYIKLSGFAWEDNPWMVGKEEKSNELYKGESADSNDKLMQNVTVRLKNSTGAIIASTTTDAAGKYIFGKVEIDQLANYYIEFIYNGMSYQSVSVKGLTNDKSTKAVEGSHRTNYNNSYTQIVKGKSKDNNGNDRYNLNYNVSDYTSKIKLGSSLKYGYSGASVPIQGVDDQYLIGASTYNAYGGYLNKIKTADQIRKEGTTELPNINLGVTRREQPNLSVKKDLESAKVSINGADHVYQYADRFNQVGTYGDGYTLSPQLKFGNKYGTMSYTRALYASDIKYTGNNSLEVKVTYKIGIKNLSTNLNAIVGQLSDFYDNKYDIVGVGTAINSDGSIQNGKGLTYTKTSYNQNNYNQIIINANSSVAAQKEGFVYVQMKVKPAKIVEIVDRGIDVKLDNVVEINSYSIKDKSGNTYAGIDANSQPGNLDVANIKTYEDDTDKAPGLKLILQEEREVSGKVFLDSTGQMQTGEVRQGNGILDTNERGISNVEVKVLTKDGGIAKSYDEVQKKWVDAKTTTNANGEYTIGGLIPQEYQVEYTWGDNTYRVQDYKSTVVEKKSYDGKATNDQWYKDEYKKRYNNIEWNNETGKEIRRSDAVDDYALRQNIDQQTEEMTNSMKDKIDKTYQSGTAANQKLIDKMNSKTPVFKVNLEYTTTTTNAADEYEKNADGSIKVQNGYVVKKEAYKNKLKSIDLGIVERAKQLLSLDKNVKSTQIMLADGNILAKIEFDENGQVKESSQYVVYIPNSAGANGQIKFEVDDEVIQGAMLEVVYNFKVTNQSEKEYLTKDFYVYGKGYGEDNNKLVTLTPNTIIDYLDNNLAIDMDENTSWKTVKDTDRTGLITNGLLSNTTEMKNLLKETIKVVTTNGLENQKLKPIQGSNLTNITFVGRKLLANTDENVLDNNAEIIKVTKSGGATIETTPGNYIPANSSTSEADNSKSETIIVLPPTGLTTDIIAYTILGISSLGILTAGIILIKKYVIKK